MKQYAIISHDDKRVILFKRTLYGKNITMFNAFIYTGAYTPEDIFNSEFWGSKQEKYVPIVFAAEGINKPLNGIENNVEVQCSSEAYFAIMSKMLFYKKVRDMVYI